MSRTWVTCRFCEHQFSVGDCEDLTDVCDGCTESITGIVSRALSTERHRIRTLLLEVAAKFGGPVGKALEEVAGRWG